MDGRNTHDLLPVPYTEATLRLIASRVRAVQDLLGQRIALENPSAYLRYASSSMTEPEFLARLCDAADCALLGGEPLERAVARAVAPGFGPHAIRRALERWVSAGLLRPEA